MKKFAMIFVVLITMSVCSFNSLGQECVFKSDMRFITVNEQGAPVADSKVIVIGTGGEILTTTTTDKNGESRVNIKTNTDPRYSENSKSGIPPRGTVTLISFKDGYRQTVLFEVGISYSDGLYYIVMKPIIKGARNEPVTQLAQNHHLETASLVDKYAKLVNEKVND